MVTIISNEEIITHAIFIKRLHTVIFQTGARYVAMCSLWSKVPDE
ncbi:hypothetical protein ACIQYG_20665 [Peribacillus sp. NPDC096622]